MDTSDNPIIQGLDDDLVVSWWQLYDSGLTLDEVAQQVKISIAILHLALGPEGLNVLGSARLAKDQSIRLPVELDEELIKKAHKGKLNAHDQALYDAVAKLGGLVQGESSTYRRHLPFASALPHHTPTNLGHHKYHPMSDRQRRMDRLATAKERRWAAYDMRQVGIY